MNVYSRPQTHLTRTPFHSFPTKGTSRPSPLPLLPSRTTIYFHTSPKHLSKPPSPKSPLLLLRNRRRSRLPATRLLVRQLTKSSNMRTMMILRSLSMLHANGALQALGMDLRLVRLDGLDRLDRGVNVLGDVASVLGFDGVFVDLGCVVTVRLGRVGVHFGLLGEGPEGGHRDRV
ncbi:uncharacterized protein LY89DRAFT_268509 [Mollisia scopiformis]|uniref:Uncharacterized protein n=1 Tax=Mollisia scopiformis TaxID=149040 RepID=A0A132BCR6_MOLSC|nr:uncharacterized protein LY89DRAFT_268509 [Mollisia scopiformis]KUJ10043.1 hypothetical protein LY89DRAFT_268509 [Mollisia scopiformis]